MSSPLFPFHTFDASTFENLCADLLRACFPSSSVELNGRKGQKQRGVDVIAASSRVYAVQCKCYEKFTVAHFEKEIEEFWQHINFWKALSVSHYVLCLAHEVDDAHFIRSWLAARVKGQKLHVELLLWSGRTIQELLSAHRRLLTSYIRDPHWASLIGASRDANEFDVLTAIDRSLVSGKGTAFYEWGAERGKPAHHEPIHSFSSGSSNNIFCTRRSSSRF